MNGREPCGFAVSSLRLHRISVGSTRHMCLSFSFLFFLSKCVPLLFIPRHFHKKNKKKRLFCLGVYSSRRMTAAGGASNHFEYEIDNRNSSRRMHSVYFVFDWDLIKKEIWETREPMK
jgi:hypothetical protein